MMSEIEYRCPDCGRQITFIARQLSDDDDYYESTLCPNCRAPHSLDRASGQVLAEDELGDPW
jgi:DNA-directed RNA polymerase subunit RPC12/RpoP